MIIPVRCFTCGKTLADKYDWYQEEVEKLIEKEKPVKKAATTTHSSTEKKAAKKTAQDEPIQEAMKHFEEVQSGEILNKLGLTRYCCRRHMLGHVDMMKVI